MTRAGLENIAATLKIDNYGQIPLETVVAQRPDVLIVSANRDGAPALATEVLRHPVIARIADRTRIVVLPTRLWSCGGPAVIDAIDLLATAAHAVGGRPGP
jgi:iron complex transport system substrate-binding protein